MKRVLLILEDFNELTFMETLLKKVGLDIDTLRNEVQLSDKLVAFSPDLIIATGHGQRIDAGRVAKKNKRRGEWPRLLALYPRGAVPPVDSLSEKQIDAALETPAAPRTIISAACQLLGIDPKPMLAKFEKLPIGRDHPVEVVEMDKSPRGSGVESQGEVNIIKGQPKPSKSPNPEPIGEPPKSPQFPPREGVAVEKEGSSSKYADALNEAEPLAEGGFSRRLVEAELKEMREYEKTHPELKSIDESRREFVKKLFQKNDSDEDGD